jgi:hypothetical protein
VVDQSDDELTATEPVAELLPAEKLAGEQLADGAGVKPSTSPPPAIPDYSWHES